MRSGIHDGRRSAAERRRGGRAIRLCDVVHHAHQLAREQRARGDASLRESFPRARARSGMMLDAVPALIVPTVTTPGCAGSSRRDTSVCSARHDRRGRDDRIARLVRPRGVRARAHDLDLERVGRRGERPRPRATTCPTSNRRSTCPPKIAATSVERARSRSSRAPRRPLSSAGCKHDERRRRSPAPAASSAAAPTAHVACTSCPHACITPGVREANGSPRRPPGSAAHRCRRERRPPAPQRSRPGMRSHAARSPRRDARRRSPSARAPPRAGRAVSVLLPRQLRMRVQLAAQLDAAAAQRRAGSCAMQRRRHRRLGVAIVTSEHLAAHGELVDPGDVDVDADPGALQRHAAPCPSASIVHSGVDDVARPSSARSATGRPAG